MTNREQKTFWLSVLISFIAWTFFFGYKFTIVLLIALLIHEYGHYYQMGREGITKKKMLAIPLLGGLAISQESFKSYFAEAKIAIAGPMFGLGSALGTMALWLTTENLFFAAATIFVCFLNLFNLLFPAAPLDGGRLIKSVLFSIHDSLGVLFFLFTYVVCLVAISFKFGMFVMLLIIYFNLQEFNYYLNCRKFLRRMEFCIQSLSLSLKNNPDPAVPDWIVKKSLNELKLERDKFKTRTIQTKMNWRQQLKILSFYFGVVGCFIFILVIIYSFSEINLTNFFKYLT